MHAVAEAEVRVRVAARCRTRSARRTRARRGWPSASQNTTFSPRPIVWPPSSTVAVAVRRFDGDGVVQRSDLLDRGAASARDRRGARRAARDARASASTPPAMALRVVSVPAANSRLKNMYSSSSVSRGGSSSSSVRVHDDRQHVVGRVARASRRSARGRTRHRCRSAAAFGRSNAVAGRGSRSRARPLRTARGGRPRGRRAGCRSSASAARPRPSTRKSTGSPSATASSERAGAPAELAFEATDRARRESLAHQPADRGRGAGRPSC